MGYQVITQPRAEEDIRDAARRMAQYAPEKTALWVFEIEHAIESLSESPARCPFAPEEEMYGMEIRQLLFEKYRILYLIEDVSVYVLRVRHQAQQGLTWDELQ